tara:strand:+ start:50 stop:307 length:258 start_codon:yes stop_codon:yes gene_type:complete
MEYDSLPHIYYYLARVVYKKGKAKYNKVVKIVTRERTAAGVMSNEQTMNYIYSLLYAKNYKGQKQVIVRELFNEIKLGKVSSKAI